MTILKFQSPPDIQQDTNIRLLELSGEINQETVLSDTQQSVLITDTLSYSPTKESKKTSNVTEVHISPPRICLVYSPTEADEQDTEDLLNIDLPLTGVTDIHIPSMVLSSDTQLSVNEHQVEDRNVSGLKKYEDTQIACSIDPEVPLVGFDDEDVKELHRQLGEMKEQAMNHDPDMVQDLLEHDAKEHIELAVCDLEKEDHAGHVDDGNAIVNEDINVNEPKLVSIEKETSFIDLCSMDCIVIESTPEKCASSAKIGTTTSSMNHEPVSDDVQVTEKKLDVDTHQETVKATEVEIENEVANEEDDDECSIGSEPLMSSSCRILDSVNDIIVSEVRQDNETNDMIQVEKSFDVSSIEENEFNQDMDVPVSPQLQQLFPTEENKENSTFELNNKKRKLEKILKVNTTDSSTEPDNSCDEDYEPTQKKMLCLDEEGRKSTKKGKSAQKNRKIFWIQIPNKNYMVPLELPEGDPQGHENLEQVNIKPGDTYLYRKSMIPIVIEKVLKRNELFKVKKNASRLAKVSVYDLLLQNSEGELNQKTVPDLSGFAVLLSLTSSVIQDMSENELTWITDKTFLTSKIKEAGGSVYNSLSIFFQGHERLKKSPEHMLLLSYKPLRTKKFLSALAYGIPIISIVWVHDCYEAGSVLDYEPYRLSNGESLLLNHWVAPKPSDFGVFLGKRIFSSFFFDNVVTESTHTASDWQDILVAAGAKLVTKNKMVTGATVDLVVCDKEPSIKEGRILPKDSIIVSTEFIIQSLIHQSFLHPQAHEKFRNFG